MGAFAVAFLGVDRHAKAIGGAVVGALSDAGYSIEYQRGYFHGFDGRMLLEGVNRTREFIVGYTDGLAGYAATREAANG
jgi:hypothetical protein